MTLSFFSFNEKFICQSWCAFYLWKVIKGPFLSLYNAIYFAQQAAFTSCLILISFSKQPLEVFDMVEPHLLVPWGKLWVSDINCFALNEKDSLEVDFKSL